MKLEEIELKQIKPNINSYQQERLVRIVLSWPWVPVFVIYSYCNEIKNNHLIKLNVKDDQSHMSKTANI